MIPGIFDATFSFKKNIATLHVYKGIIAEI